MTTIKITSSMGVDLGTYSGETIEDALDGYAREAGYRDYDDVIERVPGNEPHVEVVEA